MSMSMIKKSVDASRGRKPMPQGGAGGGEKSGDEGGKIFSRPAALQLLIAISL